MVAGCLYSNNINGDAMHVKFIIEKTALDNLDTLEPCGLAVTKYLSEYIHDLIPEDSRSHKFEMVLEEVVQSTVIGLVDINFRLDRFCIMAPKGQKGMVPLTNEYLVIFNTQFINDVVNGFGIKLLNKYWGKPHPSL